MHDIKFHLHIWHSRYGNKILVTDELPDGQMVDQWEPVSCDSVKTPLEVLPLKLISDFGNRIVSPVLSKTIKTYSHCIGVWGIASRGVPCWLWTCSCYWWKITKGDRFWYFGEFSYSNLIWIMIFKKFMKYLLVWDHKWSFPFYIWCIIWMKF